MKTILDKRKFNIVIERLAHQLIENHNDFANSVIIGIQPRGIYLSDRMVPYIEKIIGQKINYGKLDITFYRDDFAKELHIPNQTEINFSIENKQVILIDDVLFTGRTIRAALDALLAFGRPSKVKLCVLVDRKPSRELPIQPDFSGKVMDTLTPFKVKVKWKENEGVDEVILLDQ